MLSRLTKSKELLSRPQTGEGPTEDQGLLHDSPRGMGIYLPCPSGHSAIRSSGFRVQGLGFRV